MRTRDPAHPYGTRVSLYGETFEVGSFTREGMPGYWLLRSGRKPVFLPLGSRRDPFTYSVAGDRQNMGGSVLGG